MKSLKELYRIGSGPSSSHTMGPESAAYYVLNKYKEASKFEVILYGSLALTGKGHFTDKIILKVLGENRTNIIFDIKTKIKHPNTFKIRIFDNEKLLDELEFISSGGGEIILNGKVQGNSEEVYPFNSFKEICDYAENNKLSLPDVVYKFEGEEIKEYLKEVYEVMKQSIKRGLNTSGLLPGKLKVKRKALDIYNAITDDKNKVIAYAYAVSEENASMGKIVTAPTCGSCGVLPAVLYNYEETHKNNYENIVNSLAVSGLIGNTIKTRATLSGAVAGCQAEVGSACSMAASALAYLNGLSNEAIDAASEIAMEHHLGLTCDPIDGLVQIPCIERNAVAALRAIDACNIASLPIYPEKLSFDMVVDTMMRTGKDINEGYKETAKKGLAIAKLRR